MRTAEGRCGLYPTIVPATEEGYSEYEDEDDVDMRESVDAVEAVQAQLKMYCVLRPDRNK